MSVNNLGDADDDGVNDLVIAAPWNGQRQLFVLYLNADGTAKRLKEIPGSEIIGGIGPPGPDVSLATSIGDQDCDGHPEVVISGR